jgi:hypothetical protein
MICIRKVNRAVVGFEEENSLHLISSVPILVREFRLEFLQTRVLTGLVARGVTAS